MVEVLGPLHTAPGAQGGLGGEQPNADAPKSPSCPDPLKLVHAKGATKK